MKTFKIKSSIAASLFALGAVAISGQASAQFIQSGGATLPQLLWNAEIDADTSGRFLDYVGVGSGAGKDAFLGDTGTPLGLPAGPTIHWAGSDSVLSQAQVDAYLLTGHGRDTQDGRMIQVPAVGTSVNLPFNTGGVAATLNLTRAQVCGIFSGVTQNWPATAGVPVALRGQPVTVVFRSASSGTTEIFTRFLKANCPTTPDFNPSTASSTFGSLFPNGLPGNFVGFGTSEEVDDAVRDVANFGTIGYLSPDFTDTFQVASIDSVAPTIPNITAALAATIDANVATPTYTPPTNNTILTTVPGSANWTNAQNPGNPVNWAPTPVDPGVGFYPIIGYTNVLLSQCYVAHGANPDPDATIRTFLNNHYNFNVAPHHFAPLPAALESAIVARFITGTAGGNMAIGNATYCVAARGR